MGLFLSYFLTFFFRYMFADTRMTFLWYAEMDSCIFFSLFLMLLFNVISFFSCHLDASWRIFQYMTEFHFPSDYLLYKLVCQLY